jgi:hypothetical protein
MKRNLDNKDSGKDSKLKQTPITVNALTVCYEKLSERQLCAGDFKPIHDSCQVFMFIDKL